MSPAEEYIYAALRNARFNETSSIAFIQDKNGVVISVMPAEKIFKKIEHESN